MAPVLLWGMAKDDLGEGIRIHLKRMAAKAEALIQGGSYAEAVDVVLRTVREIAGTNQEVVLMTLYTAQRLTLKQVDEFTRAIESRVRG